jgi:hypothetical protein
MFLVKILIVYFIITLTELIFSDGAWAWGPAVHTVISCNILESSAQILPAIAAVIQSFPNEYIYGAISSDFFIGKGEKKKKGHSHNWETGFKFLEETGSENEAAYAYGFLSHLAADVIAHNYFVPDLIHRTSRWKRIGHIHSEAVADRSVDPAYLKIARDILSMDHLDYDRLLRSSEIRSRYGLRVKKLIFTQSIRISDYLYCLPVFYGRERSLAYDIEDVNMAFMIGLSFRLVKDLLSYPDSSACLSYDPIGSDNLRLANRNTILSKLFNNRRSSFQFPIARELLEL